jgi:hypothetical protein
MRPSSPAFIPPTVPVTLLRADSAPADADWIEIADDAPVPEDR